MRNEMNNLSNFEVCDVRSENETDREVVFNTNQTELEFTMPDGSILKQKSEVDRYYNLSPSTTCQRLKRGWTVEECANNKRFDGGNKRYKFTLPNGEVVTSCVAVDNYYNLRRGTTNQRIYLGWTEEQCAVNERVLPGAPTFVLCDGAVVHSYNAIDNHFYLKQGTTSRRLRADWTLEECLQNKKNPRKTQDA